MELNDLKFEQYEEIQAAKVFNFYGYLYLPDDCFIKVIKDCYIIKENEQYSAVDKDYFEAFLVKFQIPETPVTLP
jgi:hypothetical protein